MSNFNDQLSRMKDLIKYGSVNENDNHISAYNLEYKAQAADGKYYGIVRENSKYFVKVATPGKETIAEAYQYIGGIQNKSNYEYTSYTNALKQFELKLGSINEAYDEDRKVNCEALDPFKKEDLVIEGTDKMKNELARQRQIMRNASVIMNEATEIGSTPFKTQPEAEHNNSGDKDYPYVKKDGKAQPEGDIKFDNGKPETAGSPFAKNADVEDYDLDKGKEPKVDNSVASEKPSGGKVARVNEGMEECGAAGCGVLPEEGDEDIDLGAEGGAEEGEDVAPELGAEDELGDGPAADGGLDAQIADLEAQLADLKAQRDGEAGEEDELGGEDDLDLGDEDNDEFDFQDDDDDLDLGDEDDDLDDDDLDLGDEEGDDLGDEEAAEEGAEEADEDPDIELDENVVKKFRSLVREAIDEMMGEWDSDDDLVAQEEGFDGIEDKMSSYDDEDEFDSFGEDELFESKSRKMNSIVESVVKDILKEKKSSFDLYSGRDMKEWCGTKEFGEKMAKKAKEEEEVKQSDKKKNFNSRGSSKWAGKWADKENKINEDELHVFGDHPGYRKKPFTLPQTGSDEFQGNRDWNDDSVHSEEPFGKGKGDSTPFDKLVSQITDSVMKQINEGKKKVK